MRIGSNIREKMVACNTGQSSSVLTQQLCSWDFVWPEAHPKNLWERRPADIATGPHRKLTAPSICLSSPPCQLAPADAPTEPTNPRSCCSETSESSSPIGFGLSSGMPGALSLVDHEPGCCGTVSNGILSYVALFPFLESKQNHEENVPACYIYDSPFDPVLRI